MELIRAAELLIQKIERDYKGDVAVVVIMGSTIYGATHPRSDLDMYFVVNNPRGFELGMTFIIDGIGFDYWPISWERIEKIANYDERITSIITEGKVIYSSSAEDLKRFEELRAAALDLGDKRKFIEKSRKIFDQVYKHNFLLQESKDITSVRRHGLDVIFSMTYSLALLNRDTIKRGRGKLKGEILAMPLVPDNFEANYDVIFESNEPQEIKSSSRQLIINTEKLINSEEHKLITPCDFKDQLEGFYEELINHYNKIRHGCEIGDFVTAFYAANEIMNEIDDVLKPTGSNSSQLPDIIGAFDPNNLDKYIETVDKHQKDFETMLKDNGVEIKLFQDLNALEHYLLG